MMANDELTTVEFHKPTFLPCVPDRTSRTGYSFGAFAADGMAIEAFKHDWCVFRKPEPGALHLNNAAIYGGMLMNHFGHFLVEAMSRLWFIQERPQLPILWHSISLPVAHTPWPGWMDEVWALLGLRARHHHIILKPVQCDTVILPRSGLVATNRLHPRQVAALACVREPNTSVGRRVWLSRAGLPSQFGRIEREEVVEASLVARGWTVVRPEALAVAAQAGIFAHADIVAGFAGSAFHAVLLTVAPRSRLLLVERPSVHRNYYEAIAVARNLKQIDIPAALEAKGPMNAWTTFCLTDPQGVADAVSAAAESA